MTPGNPHDGPNLALAAVIVAGLFASVVGWVWLSFTLAALLAGHGLPGLRVEDLVRALPLLWEHRGAPADALPPGYDGRLASAPWVYLSAALVLTVGTLIGAAAVSIAVRLRQRLGADDTSARYAGGPDLHGLVVRRASPGRVILGRHRRRLIATEPPHSVLVVGPPESGKTTSLAIPAILEHDGPLLITSSKPDVLEATHAARRARGEVLVYDPIGVSGHPSVGWTPLQAVECWDTAQQVAQAMMSAGATTAGVTDESFWRASAELLIAPLLLAASLHPGKMAALVDWLSTGPGADEEVTRVLGEAEQSLALAAWAGVCGTDHRTRSSVTLTARTVTSAWWDSRVLELARPELTPERVLAGASLYLVAPAQEQKRLAPVFGAITSQLMRRAQTQRALGQRPPVLLCVLDEAAHIAPIRELPEIAATGRDAGIQLITVFQDTAQIVNVYGQRAGTVINNHRARLFLGGIADTQTLTDLSRSLGDLETQRTSTTRSASGTQTTTSTTNQPLVPVNAVRELPAGQALLVYGQRPPARLQLRPWYRDRRLRRLAAPSQQAQEGRAHMNRVQITGRLTDDPVGATTSEEVTWCRVRIAARRPGARQEPCFLSAAAFGPAAEAALRVLKKDCLVEIEGHLEESSWFEEDGTRRSSMSLVADELRPLVAPRNATPASAAAGDR